MQNIEIRLVIEILVVAFVSWTIWLFYAWRVRSLGVRALDHTNFYTFMIAVDIAMSIKGPSLLLILTDIKLDSRQGARIFFGLALITLILGFVGVWIDAKAEKALFRLLQPQVVSPGKWAKFWTALRIKGTWRFWRWSGRAILLVLSTLHSAVLVMVLDVTRMDVTR